MLLLRTIDYSQGVHPKYHLEESRLFCHWRIFGVSTDGLSATVVDEDMDIVDNLPLEKAQALVKARDDFLEAAYLIFTGSPP